MKTYYTLEKHLKAVGEVNPEYSILYSIWQMNRQSIPKALSKIAFNFPHYSLHEKSHSETIVRNIELFLGEDRIRNLSPTDTWLILMSAYTHDLGMVVFSKSIEEKWMEEGFETFLHRLSLRRDDEDLANAAKLLLQFKNLKEEKIVLDKSVTPIRLRRSLILVSADYFRRIHHERSRNVLIGRDAGFREMLGNFYSDMVPRRFFEILGKVAFSHGSPFDYILRELEYEDNGYRSDKIHPRFISCLLKIGDLLDVDDLRFDGFDEKVFDTELPIISQQHKSKHSSVKHLLISPEAIEITVDCENKNVYRVARQWFDWLEDEVENQSREWTQLAPKDLTGLPPTISKGKIKVLFDGAVPDRELLDLRFSIKPEKAIEIFEGGGIYEDTGFVFIRELVQNAIDASKIQLWKDVNRGLYDNLIIENFPLERRPPEGSSTEEVVASIKFPRDIPDNVRRNYQVDLNVEWESAEKNSLVITVLDRGCGISKKDLLRLVNAVGDSRSNDSEYQKLKDNMPYWLKPTGAFGLGMQSVFLVTDSFNVFTNSEAGPPMEIVFNSSKNGDYSYIKKEIPKMGRGTKVEVKVNKINFPVALGTSFSWHIVRGYDYFTNDEDIYVYKIEDYAQNHFSTINELNVSITSIGKVKTSEYSIIKKIDDVKLIYEKTIDESLCLAFWAMSEDEVVLGVDEDFGVGSQILLSFVQEYDTVGYQGHFNRHNRTMFSVRDMPIESNQTGFYRAPYSAIQWNLLNPESDKILNIARSKLIKAALEEHNIIFVEKILPQLLLHTRDLMLNPQVLENFLAMGLPFSAFATIAFHVKLTCVLNQVSIPKDFDYKEEALPVKLAFYKNVYQGVRYIDFFQAQRVMLVANIPNKGNEIAYMGYLNEHSSQLMEMAQANNADIILPFPQYFKLYLSSQYHISKSQLIDDSDGKEIWIWYMDIKTSSKDVGIEIDSKTLLKYFQSESSPLTHRDFMYPFLPYAQKLAVRNKWTVGFENFPSYSDLSIITPFRNKAEIDDLFVLLDKTISTGDRGALIQEIRGKIVAQYVNPKMLKWILENTAVPGVTGSQILDGYSELIADYLLALKLKK